MERRASRRTRALVALTLAAVLAGAAQAPAVFPTLAVDGEPLRGDFNADAGKARLLLFVDPT